MRGAEIRADFARGEYRWVAEVMNQGVFADPADVPARALQADALEQLDYLAVRLDAQRAAGKRLVINRVFPDVKQRARMTQENSVLSHAMDRQAPDADATITLARSTLDQITLRQKTFAAALQTGEVRATGDVARLSELLGLLDNFPPMFDVVTPAGDAKR